jgi:hypothetical protein
MMDPENISHGSAEMLLLEITAAANGAVYHADMAAQAAAAGDIHDALYHLRALVGYTRSAAGSGRDLAAKAMKRAGESA